MAKGKLKAIFFSKAALPFWLALLTFGLTELLSRYPRITESVYSQTLFPVFASVLSFISKWVSFSVDDAFYALLAIFFLTIITLTIFRKMRFRRFLLLVFQSLAICYTLFYWFWGFNYYRNNVNERLEIMRAKPDSVQFVKVLETLITETNKSYCSFDSISKPEIAREVESSYRKLAPFLKLKYPQGVREAKPITLSSFFAKASIAGYYGPFFSEVHLNDSLLMIEYPQVLAHESAHQLGVTSEAEANFYSWLVCAKSNSKHLQYSGNINTLSYFLSQARHLRSFPDLVHKIDKPVIADIRKIQQHWEQMRNEKIDKVAGKVNDVYLKTNKVKRGIEDYFGVVQFVMDFETDTLAMKKIE
jgi:hypothetical protein